MKFLPLLALLSITEEVLSVWTRSNTQPKLSTLLTSSLSNETISATGSNPLRKPKPYHVPNSPTTLLFVTYFAPRTLSPTVSYQTLVTALKSIYVSTLHNHGDGLIMVDTASWSYGGATITIENHGQDRTGQLSWGMLVDTMYGVGSFLESEACWSGEWMIEVEGLGKIGSGSIGAKVDDVVDSKSAGTVAETA